MKTILRKIAELLERIARAIRPAEEDAAELHGDCTKSGPEYP
jgi:hypothetical protein